MILLLLLILQHGAAEGQITLNGLNIKLKRLETKVIHLEHEVEVRAIRYHNFGTVT